MDTDALQFNVGDAVHHRSGGIKVADGTFHAALVIVCLSPFTLASMDGEFLFREDPRCFIAAKKQPPMEEINAAFTRWEKMHPPYKELSSSVLLRAKRKRKSKVKYKKPNKFLMGCM